MSNDLDQLAINTIRFLAADAVQAAKSGHPGAPLGAAPMAYVLFDRFLKHNPADPAWPDRDRFVLSAGHASMLLYALLHLTGYDLPLEEIKQFRQWESRTPGHPEYGVTPGVEMTTGPLGQGFAHGVGMAAAAAHLAAKYNRENHTVVDHFTYGIVSDGDLQEGLSNEAASLAGHWRLGKLIYLWDDNGIQIEGSTATNFTENVAGRFTALGWHVVGPVDGNDTDAIADAILQAQQATDKPSLIAVKTVIGYGSPLADSADCHGAPLGEENVAATKENLGWPLEPTFHVPDEVTARLRQALARGAQAQREWENALTAYETDFPQDGKRLRQQLAKALPSDWQTALEGLVADDAKPEATRGTSGKVLNALAEKIPYLFGGSADLGPSNKTVIKHEPYFGPDAALGRNVHFGVREQAMAAIAGGLALHGGFVPYTGTFLMFADYMRPPIRLAALMGLQVIYVFSHDSIGVGEDGPTHQPIEHVMSMRLVPNLTVIRPADAHETVEAWRLALARTDGPTAIVTTRQGVPSFDRTVCAPAEQVAHGAYVLWQDKPEAAPDILLLGTGSELQLCFDTARQLAEEGVNPRVVSLPSWELFAEQPAAYREQVLPVAVTRRLSVEAGTTLGWERFVGTNGVSLGIDRFGASAPGAVLFEKFGLTTEAVLQKARELLDADSSKKSGRL